MSRLGRIPRKDVVDFVHAESSGYEFTFTADRNIYLSNDGRRRRAELMHVSHKKQRLAPHKLDDELANWKPVPNTGFNEEDARLPPEFDPNDPARDDNDAETVLGKRKESLSAISLWNTTVDFGIELVHLLTDCRLEEFTLGTKVLATNSTTEKFYYALTGHLAHDSLRILEVNEIEGVDTPNPPAGTTIADYLVSGFTLARLFCFGNLTTVDLRTPVGFDIDDGTAWDIARAWPKLRSLGLQAATDLSHRPSMTLHGLRAFAKHCPDLFGLVIAVDASMVPAFDGSPNTQICQRRLTSFNVSASPISNAAVVARFLSALFPCISNMGTLHEWRWEEPAENDENEEMAMERAHHFRWKQVEETIPVMATMRAECREKIA